VNSDDGSFEPLLNTMIEHNFKKKTFHKPTFCHYCSDMLWGLTNQGVQCTACSYVSHERCHQNVKIPCNQSQQLQIPVTHSFTILKEKEKRFCNACRLKIEDQNCLVCQVCPYYAHEECRPSVIHNCKSSACYHPNYTSLHTHQQVGDPPTSDEYGETCSLDDSRPKIYNCELLRVDILHVRSMDTLDKQDSFDPQFSAGKHCKIVFPFL
jgi:hypothetical protein